MQELNVTSAKRIENSIIVFTLTDPISGAEEKQKFQDVQGGLSWPTSKAPAYFCLLGQKYVTPDFLGNPTPPGKRVLLAEFEGNTLEMNHFFDKLLDKTIQMACDYVYCELPQDKSLGGFESDFIEYSRSRSNNGCSLINAYDADNFVLGISRIQSSLNLGHLEICGDSIVASQIKGITQEDLAENPEETLHAINGLRHVLSAFYRNPPVIRFRKHSDWYKERLDKIPGTTHMAL